MPAPEHLKEDAAKRTCMKHYPESKAAGACVQCDYSLKKIVVGRCPLLPQHKDIALYPEHPTPRAT